MENSKIKEFVKEWMLSHEPETFIKDEHGYYFYYSRNGVSGINLEVFFEELLEDFCEKLAASIINKNKLTEMQQIMDALTNA